MTQRLLIVIGCILLGCGVLLGFLPQHAQGVSCGSVFHASSDARVADLVTSFDNERGTAEASCDDRRGTYRPAVILLLGLGAATLIGSTFARQPVTAPSSPH